MWQGEYWKLDIATGFMDEVLDLPVALRSWSTRCIDWGLNLATGCIGTIIGCLPRVTDIFWTRYLPAIWQAAIFTRYSTAIFVFPLHVLVANQTLISCRLLSVCVLYCQLMPIVWNIEEYFALVLITVYCYWPQWDSLTLLCDRVNTGNLI